MCVAMELISKYILPIPTSLDGVFRSVVSHINARKEKCRQKQLPSLPFRPARPAG
jgi:hypothetical protein